jgi:excisionase family DNA binding protein
MSLPNQPLPYLRFEIIEAARILRMSRATLYQRIRAGHLTIQKDGRRSYITVTELHRYVGASHAATL